MIAKTLRKLPLGVFKVALPPRTTLALSFITILISLIPMVVGYLTLNEYLYSTEVYGDEATKAGFSWGTIGFVYLICLTLIIVSIVKIVRISINSYKKRSRARKIAKQKKQ